ncbi:amidohydrolase [Burkholderia aenigmatica]|uniref:6-methylsalicylate decarboxylase n=1 Tax=Burkholderia aenigmatica TaxID=2015348 RepID=A0A6J5J5E6_9BURK|nr:amidohydrolase [Burkholderia aenigmatica]
MSDRNRIDVHQHVVPPFWADALPAHGGDPSGWGSPTWSPEGAIAFMDSLEIETGVLSLTAPGVQGWNGQAKRDMARQVNEYVAGLVAKWPTRFGNFATLPLPDVDGTLAEIGHAFDTLKADGVVLLSNYGGVYLAIRPSNPSGQNSTAAARSCSSTRRSPRSMRYPGCPARCSTIRSIRRARPSSSCSTA